MILPGIHDETKLKDIQAIATKVLLVEDEPIFQQLHFLMLEELGCEVDVVEKGEQALASLTHPYDLIFMDIGLPDMRGTVVIDKIRQGDLVNKVTPIIVLTAYNKNEIKSECMLAGSTAVFEKPITSENFKMILKTYVNKPVSVIHL